MWASTSPTRHFSARAVFAFVLVLSILAAGLLGDAPALHERLHPDAATTHTCAVTVFASGQCEAVTTAPASAGFDSPPVFATLLLPDALFLPQALFFARLEHAPPVLS